MSAQIRWCVLCNHFYEFSINNEDFYLCNKTGNKLTKISIGGDDCPLKPKEKESNLNSEW